ncbi:MAG: ribbon-helix-helix protein, CopG family [Alphaproteobacteria bacterium]|nr:ribbon-helix-helix protein, CopG family [Alphaproteobacteria bacterium]
METLSFQAPEALKARLEYFAKEMDRSKAYLIRQALEEYLSEREAWRELGKFMTPRIEAARRGDVVTESFASIIAQDSKQP